MPGLTEEARIVAIGPVVEESDAQIAVVATIERNGRSPEQVTLRQSFGNVVVYFTEDAICDTEGITSIRNLRVGDTITLGVSIPRSNY